jgi:type VI secretion system protein ImpA
VAGRVSPAEEPNWADVFQKADVLLGRTKDLRVAIFLINSGLKLDGLSALAAGLKLITALSRTYWKEVHPQLDPDDDDATLRLNSLLELEARPVPGADKQPPSLLKNLDEAPLVRAKLAGTFSRRQVKLAKNEIPAANPSDVPALALIEAAFQESDVADLQATAAAAKESLASLKDLDSHLRDCVGAQRAPGFAALRKELEGIDRLLAEQLTQRGVATAAAAPEGSAGAPASARLDGEIKSRDDVIRMLDRLSEYFRRHEPSSPVPLLLQRAKRLVAKDFLEILRELTPGGVAEAEVIVGTEDKTQ